MAVSMGVVASLRAVGVVRSLVDQTEVVGSGERVEAVVAVQEAEADQVVAWMMGVAEEQSLGEEVGVVRPLGVLVEASVWVLVVAEAPLTLVPS